MKRLIAILGAFVLLSGTFLLTASCEKDERDYELTIVVTTNDSVRVQNALVYVSAPVTGTFIEYYTYSNEQGETNYTFENKVIVEIKAAKGSFQGCTFVEVERGQNVIYVDVKPFGDVHNGC